MAPALASLQPDTFPLAPRSPPKFVSLFAAFLLLVNHAVFLAFSGGFATHSFEWVLVLRILPKPKPLFSYIPEWMRLQRHAAEDIQPSHLRYMMQDPEQCDAMYCTLSMMGYTCIICASDHSRNLGSAL